MALEEKMLKFLCPHENCASYFRYSYYTYLGTFMNMGMMTQTLKLREADRKDGSSWVSCEAIKVGPSADFQLKSRPKIVKCSILFISSLTTFDI